VSVQVLVLGMRRSGTSATTRAINLLGVPTGHETGLMKPGKQNPTGFWEMEPLVEYNKKLLALVGASGAAPPDPDVDWKADPRLEPHRPDAASLFRALHPTPSWVWKDPRNSITLPFWMEALEGRPVVVLVYRNPLEVAASLKVNASKALALGLWERYTRQALLNAQGLPVRVVRYEDLLDRPAEWVSEMRRFLREQGLEEDVADAEAKVAGFLNHDLRSSSADEGAIGRDAEVSEEQRDLYRLLKELLGDHSSLKAPLPPESPWVEPLFAERRRVVQLRRERRDLRAAYRALKDERKALERELAAARGRS
jgi:hypothetical protein